MYQPNDDIRPAGAEVDEFVDAPAPNSDEPDDAGEGGQTGAGDEPPPSR